MNTLLSGVMTNGTGSRVPTADGRPQAGKTGTIDSNEAVWFAGYTPEIAGVAMISIDNQRKPFVRRPTGYRRSGVKGYRVPSTGLVPRGLRQRRRRSGDLEAGDGGVPGREAGADLRASARTGSCTGTSRSGAGFPAHGSRRNSPTIRTPAAATSGSASSVNRRGR